MIFIKKIFLILFTCVLILCGALIFLLGTNIGTNLILMHITQRIPGLSIESVSGSWGDFNINQLIYNIPNGFIKIDKLYLSINLRYILFKQINIQHLFLNNVFVKTQKIKLISNQIEHDVRGIQINNFGLNISQILIKDIILHQIHIILDNIEFQCQKLNTGLVFQDNLLNILPIYMINGSFLNKFSLDLLKNKFSFNVKQISSLVTDEICLKRKCKTLINNILKIVPTFKYVIPVNIKLTDVQGTNFYLYNNCYTHNYYVINYFQIQLSSNIDSINMQCNFEFPNGYIKAKGNLILRDRYPINVTINCIKYNNIKNQDFCELNRNFKRINFNIIGELADDLCISYDLFNFASIIHIIFKIKLKSSGIPIELLITGANIPIPVSAKKLYMLEKINVHINGKLHENCYIHIVTELNYSDASKIYIVVSAQGNMHDCTISKLQLKIADGYCDITGNINWKNKIRWNTVSVFNSINFNKQYSQFLPIDVSGKIVTNGHYSGDSWNLTISNFQCYGYINNIKIISNGSLCIDSNGNFKISTFFIKWGTSVVEIKGGIKEHQVFDVDIKLKNINFSNFSSKLNGKAYGCCKLYGSIQSPILLLDIHAYDLKWQEQLISIKDISINSNICCNKFLSHTFLLKIDQIQYKNLLLNQFLFQGTGNVKNHRINITVHGDKLLAAISVLGEFDLKYKIWNSRVVKTNIISPMGDWKLMKDIIFSYQHLSRRIIMQSHSWENLHCSIDTFDVFQKIIFDKIHMICDKYSIFDLDLISINAIYIDNLHISFADFSWIIGSDILPHGKICIMGSQLSFQYEDNQKITVLPIIIHDTTMQFISNEFGLSVNWMINNSNNQNYGDFCITGLNSNKPSIVGKICITDVSLVSALKTVLQFNTSFKELLNININFIGCLYAPKIYGSLKYICTSINNTDPPIFIRNGVLKIIFLGNNAKIFGTIDINHKKRLYCNGSIKNINSINDIRLLLNLKGDQIDVCVSPNVYATISPYIICTITANNIDFRGSIEVPSAHIKIQELLQHPIEVSSEEVVLDQQLNPILKTTKDCTILISSNIVIYLGNDVYFNGLGLHTKLKGNLEISYNNNFTVIGHVNMFSGYIEAYGQNLTIKKGQLLFSGAINQVYLDIEVMQSVTAISHIKDSINAGIRITGMLDQLRLDFFSNSVLLSQQEIMSYLLRGNNLVLSDIDDAHMITSLLIGLSMKRYEKFINKIGHTLGVKDLKINTQGFRGSSLIALSGYIAPGLELKYSISMFDLLNTVTIRYCIRPYLYLEAISGGRYQGLDLIYRMHS